MRMRTYGSLNNGAIFKIVSRKFLSLHHNNGFCGWLLTFNILNKMHIITAIAANIAVDIMAIGRPEAECSDTISKTNSSLFYLFDLIKRMPITIVLSLLSFLITSSRQITQTLSDIKCNLKKQSFDAYVSG